MTLVASATAPARTLEPKRSVPDAAARESDPAFPPQQAARIRKRLQASGAPAPCPRCGRALHLDDFGESNESRSFFWRYRCAPCRRALTVVEAVD